MARKNTPKADCVGQLSFETCSQTVVPDFTIESMARVLLPHLREFYENPQNRAEFESWKAQQTTA